MASTLTNKLKGSPDRSTKKDSPSGDSQNKGGKNSDGGPVKSSHIIVERIQVGVPASRAYDQWTQYDKWAQMFKKESAQKPGGRPSRERSTSDNEKLTVSSKIGPSTRKWEAETVERNPGRKIVWRAKGGVRAKGVTTFHDLGDRLTLVMVDIEYHPSGALETVGNFLRLQRRRVRKDLRLFKNYIELLQEPTGKGPGSIRGNGLRDDEGEGHEDDQARSGRSNRRQGRTNQEASS